MNDSLKSLNRNRKSEFYKDPSQENFMVQINHALMKLESEEYVDGDPEFPFIFVVGAPRSSTTLTSQFIAHSLDLGYMDNIAARFWLAPVYGMRFSDMLLKGHRETDFQSHYAKTTNLSDIHEFGYFWRHWLKKESLSDVVHAKEAESSIDWNGLKRVLTAMQREAGKAMVFKNIFGGYHCKKLCDELGKVLFVQVYRDHLDEAVSILDARSKYNHDLNTWWSYAPLEYEQIKDLPYMEQIAAQVFYLRRWYDRQKELVGDRHFMQVSYEDLCSDPVGVALNLAQRLNSDFGYTAKVQPDTPRSFPYRTHEHRIDEKQAFASLFDRLNQEQ